MALNLIPLPENSPIILAGQAASKQAALATFTDYRDRKAANTVRRQDTDMALFARYLEEAGLDVGNFATDPAAWRGITWGLVEGFVKWQLLKGYSVDSVNVRLSTVKTYAQLALKVGTLDMTEYAMMRTVKGYSHKEVQRINEKRLGEGLLMRIGSKKALPNSITEEQAAKLMTGDGTPKGRRDALLMCLMLDHGLRVGEIAALLVSDFDLRSKRLVFYRQKVDKTQTHRLTERTLQAARSYMKIAPKDGNLWRHADRKGRNGLTTQGMSERGINKRVGRLGRQIGINGLSPHDLRHYWATRAARNGTPLKNLQEAGGWNSPAMPLHYIEAEQVANEGVILTNNAT
jgi:integrase